MSQIGRTGPHSRARPATPSDALIMTRAGDTWPEVYRAASLWVATVARRRWPAFATNDDIWAASVADWWVGGAR